MHKGLSTNDEELLRCCRDGDLSMLRGYLEDEDNYFQGVNGTFGKNEVSLLFEAVDHSQLNMTIYLCYKGVDVNTRAKHRGNNTALHIAISKNNDEIVKVLLSHRASTKIKNDLGETPSQKAQKCKKKSLEYLVRSCELVTLAHIICYNFNNPYKSAELTPSFEHELNYLGANFYVEYATECLMLFAKFNLITLAAKVIIAGAVGFSQGIIWAEKYDSLRTLSLLLLCQAAYDGNYIQLGQLLSDPPGNSVLPYMERVQQQLKNSPIDEHYLFKTPLIVAVRHKHILTAGLLLKHSVMWSQTNVLIDWSLLGISTLHELWVHSISPWAVSLDISGNKLTSLPISILNLRNIRQLNLRHNLFTSSSVINELSKLPTLLYLNISDNHIKNLHKTEIWPKKLQFLDISRTGLISLPISLSDLPCLEAITCQGNALPSIPNQLFASNSLKHLDLKECKYIDQGELELAINKHTSSSLKVVAPSGFVLSPKESIPFDAIIDKPKNSIISQIKRLHIPKRQTFKTNETRKVKLLLIGENGLHFLLANKLTKLTTSSTSRNLERNTHDDLMNFSWSYSPTLLKTKKVHFVTTVIRNYKQYADYMSCLLPDTVFISIVLDLSRPSEFSEAQLIAPLTNLLAHSKHIVLSFILNSLPLEETQIDFIFKERKDKIEKCLDEYGIMNKVLDLVILPIQNLNRSLQQDLTEIYKQFYELALSILQHDKCILSNKHQLIYLNEIEQYITNVRENSLVLHLLKWNIESQVRKNYNIPDFALDEHMLIFLKEVGTIQFFNLPLRQLYLYVFINPPWILTLFMHICDIIHSHHALVISQIILKDKLTLKYGDEFPEINAIFPQICQILIHFNLIVPVIPEFFLIPIYPASIRTSLSNSNKLTSDQQHHRMLFRCETIHPSFWSILISQIIMRYELVNHFTENNDGFAEDYFNCRVGSTEFEMVKIKEKTAFDGFEILTEWTNEGFSMLTSICTMIYNFIYQNFNFPNELGQALQVCVPCPTCQKLGNVSLRYFILDSILLCTVEGEHLNCTQHSDIVVMDQILPAIYFNDIPMGLQKKNSNESYFKRPVFVHGETTDHTCNVSGVMCTIRYYHFNNLTISAFYAMSNEIRILHKIEHENIVKMLDFNANLLFIVLELLPALSLDIFLSSPTIPLDRLIIYSFALQLISAVKYLHDHKIVYRILNPASILITSLKYLDDRNLMLCDFSKAASLTPFGVRGLYNTKEYQAPEILLHNGKEWYNESVDIYAYGQILNAMLVSVNYQYERDRGELISSNCLTSPFQTLPYVESNMSLSSKLAIQDNLEQPPQSNMKTNNSMSYPPYTLFIDLMRRCLYRNLRDRFDASLLHCRFSRLEIHLFQSAKQAPDPTLIGFIIPVDYNGSKQVWAIGLDVNLPCLQYRISIIYVYDQEMQNVIYSINVFGFILTGIYSHFTQLVWTAEKFHFCHNPLQREKIKTTIKAYSPSNFYQKYQFSISEETVSMATSYKFLYLGLTNGEIWLYKISSANSNIKSYFTKPYFAVRVSITENPLECLRISCIQFVDQNRTLWVVHGTTLSIYREMEIQMIHYKDFESNRFSSGTNISQNPNLITNIRLDKYESIIWMSTLMGDIYHFDVNSFEPQLKFTKLSEINDSNAARNNNNRKHIEIQSMCVGNRILWVGLTSGHVLMLSKSQIMKSWIRAHKSKVKVIEYIEYFHVPNPFIQTTTFSQTKCMIVSTGLGCHINTTLPQETNYIAKWEAMTHEEFKFLEKKCSLSSLVDELESLPFI